MLDRSAPRNGAAARSLRGRCRTLPSWRSTSDVHGADPSTLELLGRVVEQVQRLPVLALVTFRPGFAPPWAGHGHVAAPSGQTAAMIASRSVNGPRSGPGAGAA